MIEQFFKAWTFEIISLSWFINLILISLYIRRRFFYVPYKTSHNAEVVARALRHLYYNNLPELLSTLKRAVHLFPELIDLYLIIGNVIRAKSPVKSISVHRGLLFRKHLRSDEKADVLYALAMDYLQIDRQDKAVKALQESLKNYVKPECLEKLIEIETRSGHFDQAYNHQKELNRLNKCPKREGLDRISALAMNHAFETKSFTGLPQLLSRFKKVASDRHDYYLAEIIATIIEGNESRAGKLVEQFLQKFESKELTMRAVLSLSSETISYSEVGNGPWQKLFSLLITPEQGYKVEDLKKLDSSRALYYALMAPIAATSHERDLFNRIGARERLFVCSCCRQPVDKLAIVCPCSGKPLSIRLGGAV